MANLSHVPSTGSCLAFDVMLERLSNIGHTPMAISHTFPAPARAWLLTLLVERGLGVSLFQLLNSHTARRRPAWEAAVFLCPGAPLIVWQGICPFGVCQESRAVC